MIRDEVEFALARSGKTYPVEWVEEGLHQSVSALRACIQRVLDETLGIDRVLLCFGICGNMLEGLRLGDFEVVIPNTDDCISLLLNSHLKEKGILYETKGWITREKNFSADFDKLTEKHGEIKARKLMKTLLAGYTDMRFIHTGVYDADEALELSRAAAEKLNLEHGAEFGSTDWLIDMFSGENYDVRDSENRPKFLRFAPNETIYINFLQGVWLPDGRPQFHV
jgi:hypothetical protein